MVDSPKTILLKLDGFKEAKLPGALVEAVGIQDGDILEVEIPRFPRVSDVKVAASRALGIPVRDQVLRGPLPRLEELSCDWAFLWELDVLPGLSEIPSQASPNEDDGSSGGSSKGVRRRRKAEGTQVAATPGELFSTAELVSSQMKQARGAHRQVSDILQLSTRQPMADYLPGGKIYRQRMRRRFLLSALLKTLLFAAVLAAAIYILWQIPGYEMPSLEPPSYEDNSTSTPLEAGDSSSMDGGVFESGGGHSGENLGGPEDGVQQQQPEDNSQVDGKMPRSNRQHEL